jgi:LuxR family maltose regulon positive regulatory protein
VHEAEDLMLARIRITQGRQDEIQPLLQGLLASAKAGERTTRMIEILLLQALAFQARGDLDRGLNTLAQAFVLAEPEGFVRIFVDEGPEMARLLYTALGKGIAPAYTQRLLAAFPFDEAEQSAPSSPPDGETGLIEPLSERELEVLELIATGISNQEVASRLFLSLNTIKVHTRNIYSKLGVNNRIQAVARARGLGILPDS